MAQIKLKLRPFTLPNFVHFENPTGKREDGVKFDNGISIEDLDEETIIEMCEDFKQSLLKKRMGKTIYHRNKGL